MNKWKKMEIAILVKTGNAIAKNLKCQYLFLLIWFSILNVFKRQVAQAEQSAQKLHKIWTCQKQVERGKIDMKDEKFLRLVYKTTTNEGKKLETRSDFIDDLLQTELTTNLVIGMRSYNELKNDEDKSNHTVLKSFINAIKGIDELTFLETIQATLTKNQVHKKTTNHSKISRFKEARVQVIKELANWLFAEE